MVRVRHLVPGEVVVRETRASRWASLPGPVLFLLLALVLLYAAAGAVTAALAPVPLLSRAFAVLGVGSVLALAVFGFFALLVVAAVLSLAVRYVTWWSTVYAITDHRVLVQSGVFSRSVDEIPVTQIRGVDAYQSLWDRLFRYGTVRVSAEAGGGIGNEDWEGIPHPFEFQRTLESVMQNQSLGNVLRRANLIPPGSPASQPTRT
jgi:uncharacterized membrane protein YdbT with pleckstrin-like domain